MKNKIPQDSAVSKALYTNMNALKTELIRYIIANKGSRELSYEFNYDKKHIPVFLTGNDTEQGIPLFRFPVIVTSNDVTYIVSNLTGSTRVNIEDSLTDAKKTDYVDYETCRNALTYKTLIEEDMSFIYTVASQIATVWIKDVLQKSHRLDIYETNRIEGALFYYFIKTFIPDITRDSLRQKMMSSLSIAYSGTLNYTDKMLDKLTKVDFITLDDAIREVAETSVMKDITLANVNTLLTSKWYSGGDGSQYDVLTSIDSPQTMTAIMYHALTTITGKKTILGKFLKDNKRLMKLESFENGVSRIMKEVTIR